MPITINKLHKILGDAIEQGWGYRHVCISKKTFSHPLESDGVIILPVEEANVESFPVFDDDGFQKIRKDGAEVYRIALVLRGNNP